MDRVYTSYSHEVACPHLTELQNTGHYLCLTLCAYASVVFIDDGTDVTRKFQTLLRKKISFVKLISLPTRWQTYPRNVEIDNR
jgi:hypothetical protein